MEVPEGMKKWYPKDYVILLLKTIYGLKQVAYAFWVKLVKAFRKMKFKRSKADPCLYYTWDKDHGLIIIISWIDDIYIAGKKAGVLATKAAIFEHFECDDTGEVKEYVGNKVDRTDDQIKLTQESAGKRLALPRCGW